MQVARYVHVLIIGLFSVCAQTLAAPDQTVAREDAAGKIRLLVLELELTGDLSNAYSPAEYEARTQKLSEHLRAEMARLPAYEVVDPSPARERIEMLRSVQYLHKCNGCEFDIAREVGAEQVLVAWIHRVSQLILTLKYEIRDVQSGRTVAASSYSFRGDNDTAWARAVTYMVNDLAGQGRSKPGTSASHAH